MTIIALLTLCTLVIYAFAISIHSDGSANATQSGQLQIPVSMFSAPLN